MRWYVVSVFLFLSPLMAAGAYALEVETRIDAVTVYERGATVTRIGEVNLSRGENVLEFVGLSGGIDRNGFQVEITGAGAALGQVRFDKVEELEAISAEVRRLQAAIRAVELRIAGLDDSNKTAQLKLQFLEGIAQGYAKESWFEGARGSADIDSWRTALTVLEEGAAGARTTIRDNGVAKREAEQELSKLRREISDVRGKRRASLNVTTAVAADSARTATVKLHYFQPRASWSPQYIANLNSDSRQLRLAQRALVRQTTDESWTSARLTLSTSEPTRALEAPELESEFLDFIDLRPLQRKSMPSSAMEEVVVSADYRPEPLVDNFSVSYDVPGRVDVPNNASEALAFDLANFEFATKLVSRVVPLESTTAFLTARFSYEQNVPLQGAGLLVYVDQVYVGESYLETILPGGDVALPMGLDRRIGASVRDQGPRKDEGGFIGRRKEERTDYVYEIANRRGSSTEVEVLDRYPTAVDQAIEVTIPRQATPPTERDYDGKPGLVLWRKTLGAGETWRINHQYEVSYPADRKIAPQ